MNKIVKFIEDEPDDASLYCQLLEAAGDIKVEHVNVLPTLDDYTDLLTNLETGAIIIDERLSPYGGVNYTGLQLADFLRTIRPEIPIYILTNYSEDIPEDQGESVEFIIDKQTVLKKANAKVYVARILRHMQQYEVALTEQQRRLKNLIDRKLTDGLNNEEEEELKQLRAKIERPSGPAIIDEENKWIERERKQEEDLRRQEELLERLEKIAQKNQDLSNA